MKKRLLCIAAAVLMVLAAVFAFGCEKQFPSENEVLKSHLDKYCMLASGFHDIRIDCMPP